MGAERLRDEAFQPARIDCAREGAAASRRAAHGCARTIEIGKLAIDPASYRVSHSGKAVPLSTLEFRLLYYLASRPNRVFTRDQLLDAVWGTDRFVTPRSVDVYVRRLREKIESDPEIHSLENGSRRGLFVRNPCGLIFSGNSRSPF